MSVQILPMVPGERAWRAADRAAGVAEISGQAHYDGIRNAGPVWTEIDEEAQWEALEILPPIYFPGGFAVSEAVCDGSELDSVIHLCVVCVRGRYFARYAVMSAKLRDEVRSALEGVTA